MNVLHHLSERLAAAPSGSRVDVTDGELDAAIIALLPRAKPAEWTAAALTISRVADRLAPFARHSHTKNRVRLLMARRKVYMQAVRAADGKSWVGVLWAAP